MTEGFKSFSIHSKVMNFLDEVTRKFWKRIEDWKRFSYEYCVKFKGNTVIIEPGADHSKLELFKKLGHPNVKAHIKPISIDLGDSPIKATIKGRLTHNDLLLLLEAAEAEKLIGEISYQMPINSVRLTGFPKGMSNNLDGFSVTGGGGWIESRGMMISQPRYAIFKGDVEEKVEKLPYVEKIEKEPGKHPRAIFLRRPDLSEVEQTALSLSENSNVELIFGNPKKSQIKEVNPIYDSSLREINGDIAAYDIKAGKWGASISIRPPFEKTVEALERSFEKRVVYMKDAF